MSDPLDSNDDWAELARELERNTPPQPAAPIPTEPPITDGGVDSRDDAELASDEEFADGDDGEAGSDSEAETTEGGDSQPGSGRKRRRRRRRRRKGGAPTEGATATSGEPNEITSETEIAEAVPVADHNDYAMPDSELSEEFETEPLVAMNTEEDTATEVLRELIANWNVPSWDSIVSGLHRP